MSLYCLGSNSLWTPEDRSTALGSNQCLQSWMGFCFRKSPRGGRVNNLGESTLVSVGCRWSSLWVLNLSNLPHPWTQRFFHDEPWLINSRKWVGEAGSIIELLWDSWLVHSKRSHCTRKPKLLQYRIARWIFLSSLIQTVHRNNTHAIQIFLYITDGLSDEQYHLKVALICISSMMLWHRLGCWILSVWSVCLNIHAYFKKIKECIFYWIVRHFK